jgi:hypothetical protein
MSDKRITRRFVLLTFALLRGAALLAVLPLALNAEDLWFDGFIPSDVFHNYAGAGVENHLHLNGRPITMGMRVVLLGAVIDRNIDGHGAYLDLKGAPSIGH